MIALVCLLLLGLAKTPNVCGDFGDDVGEIATLVEERLRSGKSLFGKNVNLKKAFKLHDYNDDDNLSKEEAAHFYENDVLTKKQTRESLDSASLKLNPLFLWSMDAMQVFQYLDKDQNGLISFKEFHQFYKVVVHDMTLFPELGHGSINSEPKTNHKSTSSDTSPFQLSKMASSVDKRKHKEL
eukprot:gene1007-4249_t